MNLLLKFYNHSSSVSGDKKTSDSYDPCNNDVTASEEESFLNSFPEMYMLSKFDDNNLYLSGDARIFKSQNTP